MKVGRISLAGGVAGIAGLLLPGLASAQTAIDTSFYFEWLRIGQTVCLDRGTAAIDQAIAAFNLTGANTRQAEWYAFGDADNPVILVYCIADDETEALVAPDAKRVLVSVSVNGTDAVLIEDIRDFVRACIVGECPTILPPQAERITWNTNASQYRGQNGVLIDFVCPRLTGDQIRGAVWGTDTYTDDSAICQAALHAGAITESGGTVTIEILPGEASYSGTLRNGVQTSNWGSYSGSYRFVAGG